MTRLDPASGRVITTIGLPARPLAVGAGSGMVWVRSANRWLWRVDPTYGRQVGSIRLASVAGGAELAGELVVARAAVWISDPGPGVVRRVDLRRETEDLFEADGRDLAVTPGGTVWATSHTRLLGLGGSEVRGPAVPCTSCTPIGSPRWRPRPMVGCGWARPRDCSTSTSASWASGSTARVIPRASPPSHMGARRPRYWPRCRPCRPC